MKKLVTSALWLLIALSLPASLARAAAPAAPSDRVFELRVYTPNPGKLDALLTRFREHTCGIFARLGMENVAYWVEAEPAEGAEPKLYYVLAHPSRAAAKDAWAKFMADPEWQAAYAESIKDGKLVVKVESTFLHPADFSPLK